MLGGKFLDQLNDSQLFNKGDVKSKFSTHITLRYRDTTVLV
jgi:hypothetical protein